MDRDFRADGSDVGEQLWGADRFAAMRQSAHDVATDEFFDFGLLAFSLFKRDQLDFRTRLLVLVAVDAAGGLYGALKHHVHACLNNGIRRDEINEVLTQIAPYAGLPRISEAFSVVAQCCVHHEASDPDERAGG